jgi:hypothetical protein
MARLVVILVLASSTNWYWTDWWYGVEHHCNHYGVGGWPICKNVKRLKHATKAQPPH